MSRSLPAFPSFLRRRASREGRRRRSCLWIGIHSILVVFARRLSIRFAQAGLSYRARRAAYDPGSARQRARAVNAGCNPGLRVEAAELAGPETLVRDLAAPGGRYRPRSRSLA